MDFRSFADDYLTRFAEAILGMDRVALQRIATVLEDARARDAQVLICGNGGSAAIANHMECDCSKGTFVPGTPPLRSRSLAANTSILTATANDHGYDTVFARQLEWHARSGDVLVVVSSGGSSPNVVAACARARELGLVTVALVGFSGGALKGLADVVLHVPVHNYGIVEDSHQAVVHLITQWLRHLWEVDAARAAAPVVLLPLPG